MLEYEFEPTRKRNRIKKRKAKLGLQWCHGCDRDLVSISGKCKVCGNKEPHKRRKK